METLYRKVAISERMPDKSGFYFTYSSSGVKKTIWFMNDKFSYVSPSYNPDYWLEEVPDPTAQLQADKEELLEALEKATDLLEAGFPEISTVKDFQSLIQKHKQ